MEDKILLNDEELGDVVGGFADKGVILDAFDIAERRFANLRLSSDHSIESGTIVNKMKLECMLTSKTAFKAMAVVVVDNLEELYSQLITTDAPVISNEARNIIDELKSSLGL